MAYWGRRLVEHESRVRMLVTLLYSNVIRCFAHLDLDLDYSEAEMAGVTYVCSCIFHKHAPRWFLAL